MKKFPTIVLLVIVLTLFLPGCIPNPGETCQGLSLPGGVCAGINVTSTSQPTPLSQTQTSTITPTPASRGTVDYSPQLTIRTGETLPVFYVQVDDWSIWLSTEAGPRCDNRVDIGWEWSSMEVFEEFAGEFTSQNNTYILGIYVDPGAPIGSCTFQGNIVLHDRDEEDHLQDTIIPITVEVNIVE